MKEIYEHIKALEAFYDQESTREAERKASLQSAKSAAKRDAMSALAFDLVTFKHDLPDRTKMIRTAIKSS